MSPYSVAYPTAISDLLPVVRTIEPNLFESAISSVPRMRAWMFSSVEVFGTALELASERARTT